MQLAENMTHAEAIRHLRATVPAHLTHEAGVAIEGFTPFAAVRSIFAGIEYVSALYAGWDGKDDGSIATKAKTIQFLHEVFPAATGIEEYSRFACHLYAMFRSGTVHLYVPRRLHNPNSSTPFLTWCVLTGERAKGKASFRGMDFIASHLMPVAIEDTTILPLAPALFLADFIKSCELFARHLEEEEKSGDHALLDRWRKTADALSRPARADVRRINLLW